MSLKQEFKDLAIELIDSTFLSVSQEVILSQPIMEQYDEESGMVFTSSEEITVNAIVGPWQNDRRAALNSDAIQTEDLAAIMAFDDVSLNLRIGNDTATLPDGSIYQIVAKITDEAEATITLRLAKINEQT